VLVIMRRTMQDIDDALAGFTRHDTTLTAEPNQDPRRLSIWLEGGVPRKLVVSEPNDAGQMLDESVFWFVQGELRVVQQPADAYAFEADRILIWTDGSLQPVTDISTEERMQRERAVVDSARRWLQLFGLTLM
jgi:hypothetical protein